MKNIEWGESNNPPYDNEACFHIESELGIIFPKSYLDLLRKWNGGYSDPSYQIKIEGNVPIDLDYYLREGFWDVSSIAGIWDSKGECSMLYLLDVAKEWGLPEKVIPLQGDGHTWVAFDYRGSNNAEPKVIFIESDENKSFILANNFNDFVGKLIPYADVYDYDGNIIYQP
ncbi:SMI1/KNR4 family protein [Shewanella surugensis]|uniref:SMI1/KNR4 family protein n=1 Tax=Shewanella surugensis TaxID=212020 RepID=A0ABT0LEX1_9GAMM|nr:SMI1/KNR4 family protein [Shewanella surugensis]MCL1125877.1 SMI1/KNR4 family protein [Shewanella surugensis]